MNRTNVVPLQANGPPQIDIHYPNKADYLSSDEVAGLTPQILRQRTETLKRSAADGDLLSLRPEGLRRP